MYDVSGNIRSRESLLLLVVVIVKHDSQYHGPNDLTNNAAYTGQIRFAYIHRTFQICIHTTADTICLHISNTSDLHTYIGHIRPANIGPVRSGYIREIRSA